jgi:ribose transport system permease protein
MTTIQRPRTRQSRILETVLRFQGYLGLLIVFLIGLIFSPVRDGSNLFVDPINQANILRDVAETGIIAIGMTFVILVAEIDLSVGSVLALTATFSAAMLVRLNLDTGVVIVLGLMVGGLAGLINGLVTTWVRIPSFVVTLAMMSFARGFARLALGGLAIPVIAGTGGAPESFFVFAQRWFGIPVPAIVMLVVAIISGIILRFTPFGRHVYAVGGNPVAARLSGVRVDRVKIIVFVICGVLTALAGIIHAAQLNQGSPNDGVGYELNAIAAVVIGGTSLMGGIGTLAGSIIGAWMLGMIDNILGLNNINSDVQLLIKGALIVAAVGLQRLQRRA